MAVLSPRLNVGRLNAFRLDGYSSPFIQFLFGGVNRTGLVRVSGDTITQNLNDTPDTCRLRVEGFTPVKGQQVRIELHRPGVPVETLFAGHILTVTVSYEDVVTNLVYDVNCIDYTWRLNARRVNKRYVGQSATSIVLDLMASYANTMTVVNVAADLPTIDEIQFTNEELGDALSRVAARIGGYWYLDYDEDLHFFVEEDGTAPDVTDGMAVT